MRNNLFAIVTGASTGIGRAIAVALARNNAGSTIALLARREDKLKETKALVENNNGKAEIYPTDLANIDSIQETINAIKKQTDHIDTLVNVAGIWHGHDEVYAERDFETFPQEVITETFNVGVLAPTLLCHAVIPVMLKQGGGDIINISGTFENGAKGWLPYYVSKRAIEDLTVGLAQEYEEKNIQVNAISPSDTATEAYGKFFPQYMNEAISPDAIAKQVAFLISPEADGVTGKVFVMKKDKYPSEGFHS